MRRSLGRILFGVVLVLFGIMSLLENFGYDIHINFDGWWTVFIIVPCVASMMDEGIRPGNLIGAFIGLLLLARAQNWIPQSLLPLFSWPVLLIIGGLALVFGRGPRIRRVVYESDSSESQSRETYRESSSYNNDDAEFPDYFVLFGGSDIRNTSRNLRGASITSIFGGIDADFTRAVIDHDITIHVTAVFGGSDIYLPSNVRVRFTGVPIFGGTSNQHEDAMSDNAPLVTIHSFSLFGGTEIH